MLVIRFSRVGKKNRAQFRIVAQEHTMAPSGKHVEILGSYDPHFKKGVFKKERIEHWIKNGAQISDSVYNVLVKQGIIKGKKRFVKITAKKEKGKPASAEATEGKKKEEKEGEEKKSEEKKEGEDAKEEKPASAPAFVPPSLKLRRTSKTTADKEATEGKKEKKKEVKEKPEEKKTEEKVEEGAKEEKEEKVEKEKTKDAKPKEKVEEKKENKAENKEKK